MCKDTSFDFTLHEQSSKKGRILLLHSPLFVKEWGKREGQDNPSSFSALLMQSEIKRGILGVCNIEPLDPDGGGVAYN